MDGLSDDQKPFLSIDREKRREERTKHASVPSVLRESNRKLFSFSSSLVLSSFPESVLVLRAREQDPRSLLPWFEKEMSCDFLLSLFCES